MVKTKAGDATPRRLIASAPVLMNPAETSVGVAFAVSADASGWAEYSTSPDMRDATRVSSGDGCVMRVDGRFACIRLRGLSPATRYFYRIGADRIEFLLAPNPGEGEKSLQKAVSGGELSRVLLAIKSVMAELDKVPLLIFDEVDSGISGETGNSIGEALRNLGKHHQVLTITHLHQVASRAQNQLAVSKKEIDGRTFTSIIDLDNNGRIEEIARMLGGTSETVRTHAKQLLENNL